MNISTPPDDQNASKAENTAPAHNLRLEIKKDRMTAHLIGKKPEAASEADVRTIITNLVRNAGIKQGLDIKAIQQAIKMLHGGETLKGMIVARGEPPKPGTDAAIKILTEVSTQRIGRVLENGHVDFRDKGPLPVLPVGTKLAQLIPAEKGIPGIDVTGRPVQPPPVRLLRLKAGTGVRLESEETLAVADHTGMLNNPAEEVFEILTVHKIEGDVDFHTGHIDFPGMVEVTGTVLSDFHVKSKALIVNELEPGSLVEVEGDMAVTGGIMGAKVKAGGRVTARFCRDSDIEAGGDVVIENEIVQCSIKCEGSVFVTRSEGRIVNSNVAAIQGVIVAEIISSGSEISSIRIGPRPEYIEKLLKLRRKLNDIPVERRNLLEAMGAQEEELKTTEGELRDLLAVLKKTEQQEARLNLITQVNMIKPLRENLQEGVNSGRERLAEMEYEEQRLAEEVRALEAVTPEGTVWLDVLKKCSATTEILGPRSAKTLKQGLGPFSATEVKTKADGPEAPKQAIKVSDLRSMAQRKITQQYLAAGTRPTA